MHKRSLLILSILAFSILLFGCSNDESTQNNSPTQEQSATNFIEDAQQAIGKVTEDSTNSLGMTLTEFAQAFDDISKDLIKDGLAINQLDFKDGKFENNYIYEINNRILLSATINKTDRRIKELSVTAQPSEFNSENMETLAVFNLVVMTLNPELEGKQLDALFKELKFSNSKDLKKLNSKAIRTNNEYSMQYKDKIGVVLSVKNKNDI